MKLNTSILWLFIITISVVSCEKDQDPPQENPPPVTYADYSPLAPGNYWIYQRYLYDMNGVFTPTNFFDSCYVEKDTAINGNTFYKMVRPSISSQPEISYIRDSLHYIVSSEGRILFSSVEYNTVFESNYFIVLPTDTVCQIEYQMTEKDWIFATPSGNYVTSNFRKAHSFWPAWSGWGNVRYMHTRYAENIGIVAETMNIYAGSPTYYERRLVSYHLN